MDATFKYIWNYLQKEYKFTSNQAPPLVIEGGQRYPIDITDRIHYNWQIILIANEFKSEEGYDVSERVRYTNEQQLGVEFLPYSYDTFEKVDAVIDGFATHFNVAIDKAKVIRRLYQKDRNSHWVLYVSVVQIPYYV